MRTKETNFIIQSQEHLDLLLNYWMEVLELFDWEIHATFVDDLEGDCGRMSYVETTKQGILSLVNFDKRVDNKFFEWDMEMTLVHELLHAKFADLSCNVRDTDMDNVEYRKLHQIIDALSRSLVLAKREQFKDAVEGGDLDGIQV